MTMALGCSPYHRGSTQSSTLRPKVQYSITVYWASLHPSGLLHILRATLRTCPTGLSFTFLSFPATSELGFTPLSSAAPSTKLRWTLSCYAAPYWATLYPLCYNTPNRARLHPSDLRSTLLKYTPPAELLCTLTELPSYLYIFRMPECRTVRHLVSLVLEWKEVPMLEPIRYRNKETSARKYRPCFRENQPKRSFSIKWKRAFWACFRENSGL